MNLLFLPEIAHAQSFPSRISRLTITLRVVDRLVSVAITNLRRWIVSFHIICVVSVFGIVVVCVVGDLFATLQAKVLKWIGIMVQEVRLAVVLTIFAVFLTPFLTGLTWLCKVKNDPFDVFRIAPKTWNTKRKNTSYMIT